MPTDCPAEQVLNDFVAGVLPPDESTFISEHLHGCPRCAARLHVLECVAPVTDVILADLKQVDLPTPPSDPEFRAAVEKLVIQAPVGQTLAIGAVIDDYQLVEILGEGGMGVVYRAIHTRLDKEVALKVIRRARALDPFAADRFRREMKAAGRVRHPNLVQATDAGVANGVQYLVMEYVPGKNLARLVLRDGPLPLERACELIRQAALGLHHAHQHGLVHRDVKPSNLLLGLDGIVRVLDLGLALWPDETSTGAASTPEGEPTSTDDNTLTAPGQQLGTKGYMAPEQRLDSHKLDARADVYSLGCTLVYLLTGHPRDPQQPCPECLPTELWAKFLAHEADKRFPSALAAAEALVPFCGAQPTSATPGRRPRWAAIAALALGVIAAIVLLSNLGRSPGSHDLGSVPQATDPLQVAPMPRAVPPRGYLPMTGEEARTLQKRWADHRGQPVSVNNSLGMELVLIPPGEFAMSQNYHVAITRPYRIGKTEVTWGQYDQFARGMPYRTAAERVKIGARFRTWRPLSEFPFPQDRVHRLSPGWGQYDPDQPIGFVNWDDVDAFLAWLSATEGRKYRLPTHAEWVWACRAGTPTGMYWDKADGAAMTEANRFAWSRSPLADRPKPVGRLLPNAWGLYDMIGNVEELVRDYAVPNYTPSGHAIDPTGPAEGISRVTCGGSYADALVMEPSTQTGAALRSVVYSNQGFRVVLEP